MKLVTYKKVMKLLCIMEKQESVRWTLFYKKNASAWGLNFQN